MIICDCHVHIYPGHDLWKLLDSAWNNLNALAPEAEIKMLLLTERLDCHFFKKCQQGEITHPKITFHNFDDAIEAKFNDNRSLWIVAGRQINTAERLELLALTKDLDIKDGLPYKETIAAIQASGALAVINWAPGKWFFKRGDLVASIIESYSPDSLLFCDTTLRCIGWPEPTLMRRARAKGFQIIAGSDPLPIDGEELIVATYAVKAQCSFDIGAAAKSAREMLTNRSLQRTGNRSSPFDMIRRIAVLKKTTPARK